MNAPAESSSPPQPATSLPGRLLNVLATPGEVFEEVAACPASLAHWLVPTVLVCLTGIMFTGRPPEALGAFGYVAGAVQQPVANPEAVVGQWRWVSAAAVCLSVFVGTAWAAAVLWVIGRCVLGVRISFLKTLEIVGLSAMVVLFGIIISGLLAIITGNPDAHPALSLLMGKEPSDNPVYIALDTINVFHLWAVTLMAMGLARLCGVRFNQAAFYVFGYWLVLRFVLVLLS